MPDPFHLWEDVRGASSPLNQNGRYPRGQGPFDIVLVTVTDMHRLFGANSGLTQGLLENPWTGLGGPEDGRGKDKLEVRIEAEPLTKF